MLKEGSVLSDNTASAPEANESSVDSSPNEREVDYCPHIQALLRAIERGKCATGCGEETRERRQKQTFVYVISEIVAAAPKLHALASSLKLTVQCLTNTERASM